ncbi:TPA: hypothetical protein EYN98_20510 [Candidatus Poribacteria bacterium]|nr:hypothetical protein [Candidatus Poribacteria bacterium]HIA68384.1 hypothetical protein [Candidatus Poribacteria bacterium]HIB88430.1 hypothetical protein [Candidatus Poribacteria bacterium]HIB99823.1 hypothetical protein [Candidatus Poribacteria bacterium]HIN28439.1 hypothetical protein [Candidatus Poribacteria bacterium]
MKVWLSSILTITHIFNSGIHFRTLVNGIAIVILSLIFLSLSGCDDSKEEAFILPVPQNLKATIINQGIDLTWEIAEGTTGVTVRYNVYRATGQERGYILLGNSARLQYLDQGVTADRTYFYLITFVDDQGNESGQSNIEQITFVVPILNVTATLMNFGKGATDLPLQINNTGSAILKWKATINQDWVTLNVKNGTIEAKRDQTIKVHVDRNRPPGAYSAVITIESEEDYSIVVRVTLDIPEEPVLFTTPQAITFGPNDIFRTIEIRNNGTGLLDWQIGGGADWLEIQSRSGKITTKTSIVTLQIDRMILVPGQYNTVITVSGINAGRKTVKIVANITQAVMDFSVSQIDFGDFSESQQIKVKNVGKGLLSWSAKSPESWIQLTPSSGIISQKQVQDVNVRIFRSQLDAAEYIVNADFTGSGGNRKLPIRVVKLGSITGTVSNAHTGLPINGSRLQTLKNKTLSDSGGNFILSYNQEGIYPIKATADGYFSRWETAKTKQAFAFLRIDLSPVPRRRAEIRNRVDEPTQVAHANRRSYVTSENSNQVLVLDAFTNTAVDQVVLKCSLSDCHHLGIAANPVRPEVYVTVSDLDQVLVIDTTLNQEVHQFTVGDYPADCVVSDDGSMMYVSLQREDKIAVVDLSIPMRVYRIGVGKQPAGLVLSPNGNLLYVACTRSNSISVIDVRTQNRIMDITVGHAPNVVAMAKNGRYIYVINTLSDDLSIIDMATHNEVIRLRIGIAPIGVSIRRELNGRELAFVLDYNGKIRIIEMPLQVIYDDINITSGRFFKSISYNQYTNQFYILSANSPQIRILY